ncbi:hypothetical protein CF032_13780 [Klebsiella oxytoca]|uniref:DUF726 domain-containing protein n=1 Tax=Klebsiella oxytoca TaxID=571 RepID=UPI001C7F05C1|nr:DUF726 domain-containing protein [Klebsiella oxytoca]MBX4507745.1 hypothetical protein [Klebsiella oxytoca]
MDNGLTFEFCNDNRGETINIFIHGYSAVRCNKNKLSLKQFIPERKKETNIFMFWPSGKIFGDMLKLQNLIKYVAINPMIALAKFSYDEILQFKTIESNIPNLTYEFICKLKKFIKDNDLKNTGINLYGHSLGARLIIETIFKNPDDCKDLKFDNLIFMGGARSLDNIECENLLSIISGHIYNIHSSSDYVLKFVKPDFEKCIGRHPIQAQPELSYRIKNHPFDFLGHMDYWENIKEIIKYLNLDGASNSFVAPGHNTFENNPFPAKDVPLYIPICYASVSEKEIIAKLICLKNSSSISENEKNPIKLTNEIQLMGGDSIINKVRGHGVIYSEIVHDVAEHLNIPDYQNTGFKYLEQSILEKVLNELKKESTSTDENKKILISKIIQTLYRHSEDGYYHTIHMEAFIKLVELIKKSNLKSLYISGPAYSITVPLIIIIHHIRIRLINEIGVDFLSV